MKHLGPWACISAAGILCLSMACAADTAGKASNHDTYNDDEVAKAASEFFSSGAKELATVLEKVLKEKGHPVAIIRGEEAGGALAVGLRYGHGELLFKDAAARKVYWQGPSIGFDAGANASKAFILVYGLPNAKALFRRFPGVDGSLYFLGGFGVNYVQSEAIALAPVRFGVGWRQGINVGYMNFSPEKRYNPF
jgi:hypothetical protein